MTDSPLSNGMRLQVSGGQRAVLVGSLLGAGGQGAVHKVSVGGRAAALKWYFQHAATVDQRKGLERLVRMGPPDSRFLWPDALVDGAAPGFGYLMRLRPDGYASIVDLMLGRVDPSFRALILAGWRLADSFLQLHARGLCYRDISFGNVFFDPDLGRILICDNDNVGVDGQGHSGVLGTPRFMAPEVVRGDVQPSAASDRWSLAVLLFYLMYVHHPLEGALEARIKCLDLPAMTRLYGTHPLYIFHPHDGRNAPVAGLHDNAIAYKSLYPQALRSLFERAFVDGMVPERRVRESEWRTGLLALHDSIHLCPHCGAECFFDPELAAAQASARCWSCHSRLPEPPRVRLEGAGPVAEVVVLSTGAVLFPHHVDSGRRHDLSRPVAEVVAHPRHPEIRGLKNRSERTWRLGDGTEVPPGRSATLGNGLSVDFGTARGTVRA